MGKAALLLVLATSITVAYGLASKNETGQQTARHQANFEENVIAREIARSGFNVAMGILRQHGDDLQAGVHAVNGSLGYLEGEHQGGVYRARARYVTGHSAEVISTGYFGGQFSEVGTYQGGAQHVMEDNYTYRVTSTPLVVKQCSRLNLEFIQSMAGYCSAVYMQRRLPGIAPADQPAPEMVFAPGQNRNGGLITIDKYLFGGTQLNFFIGVSKNCNPYGNGSWKNNDFWKNYDVESHVFIESSYDHVHPAFNRAELERGEIAEAIWAMVEQHPSNNQRWRIAWEDQHNTSWDQPTSPNPSTSLQALKALGYDGRGWPDTDARGYRTLRDYESRPDFSDQVIEVSLSPLPYEQCVDGGAPVDDETEQPVTPPLSEEEEYLATDWSEPDYSLPGCPCPGKGNKLHKVLINHYPPGNTGNVRQICVAHAAANAHYRLHDDHQVCVGK